jgi:pilus assembly protein Flp/PilA
MKMRNTLKRVATWLGADSESGVTAIEYGLIAALIAVVIIVGVTAVGTNLAVVFTTISGHLASAV